MQAQSSPLRSKLAPAAVRLAALWVLSVTSIKLFKGSANDLPEFIRHNFFGPELNFNLSIGVELSCAFIALFHPRKGFFALTALSTVFIGVLVYLLSTGATSCGCFGGAIKVPPWAMLTIDGAFLLLMLATKPWESIRPTKFPLLLAGVAVIAAFAAPWVKNPPREAAPLPVATTDGGAPAAWKLPPKPWRNYEPLPAVGWIGKSIHSTELAIWVDTHAHQTDGTWILYRAMCPHCADYIRRLFNEYTGEQVYLFVRVPESGDGDESGWTVNQFPPGEKTSLPEGINWDPDPETPCELILEGGIVKSATFRGDA